MTNTQLSTMPTQLSKIYENSFSSQSSVKFFPTIRIDSDEELFYIKGDEKKNIGKSFKGQILLMCEYYSYYDEQENKVLVDTNKFTYGDDIYVFNYLDNTIVNVGKNKAEFKKLKDEYKERGFALKYNKVLYILIEDESSEFNGQVVEMYVKLSQSHGLDKDKHYRLQDPMEGGLGVYLNNTRKDYPNNVLTFKVSKYKTGPILIMYPSVSILEPKFVNIDKALETLERIRDLNNYKYSNILKENENALIDDTELDWSEGNQTTHNKNIFNQPDESNIIEAEVITDTSDDLPF